MDRALQRRIRSSALLRFGCLLGLAWPSALPSAIASGSKVADLTATLDDLTHGQRLKSMPSHTFAALLQSLPMDAVVRATNVSTTSLRDPSQQERGHSADGKALRSMARLLPQLPGFVTAGREMPGVNAVWQDLLLRTTPVIETRAALNFMVASFANYIFEDIFSTQHDTGGAQRAIFAPPLGSMSQLYGQTLERQHALRTMEGGKMKTSRIGQLEFPPLLADIHNQHHDFEMSMPRELQMTCPVDSNTTCNKYSTGGAFRGAAGYYALGSPRLNAHIGHLVWATMFLRMHNRLCDLLVIQRSGLDDQTIFDHAQLIVRHIAVKFLLEDYLFDTISFLREQVGMTYDPDSLRELPYPKLDAKLYLEFGQLHRWHNLVPQVLDIPSGKLYFTDFCWNPAQLATVPMPDLLQAFLHTRTGAFVSNNIPYYLGPITRQTLEDSRKQRQQGYNAYRVHFGLQPLHSFEDFGLSEEVTAQMQQLYNDVDAVEFYVGILLEQPSAAQPQYIFGEGMTVMMSTFILSAILNLDLIIDPALWSNEVLTPEGRAYVQRMTMADFLQDFGGAKISCPFRAPGRPCPTSVTSVPVLGWGNIFDFVGGDVAIRPVLVAPAWGSIFLVGISLAFVVAVVLFGHRMCLEAAQWLPKWVGDACESLRPQERGMLSLQIAFVVVLGWQLVSYLWWVGASVFGGDLVLAVQTRGPMVLACVLQHAMLYAIEAHKDRAQVKGPLLWQRVLWVTVMIWAGCSQTVFGIKLAMIVDVFAVFEVAIYAALIALRLKASWHIAQIALFSASALYSVTAILQSGLLAAFSFGSHTRLQRAGQLYLLWSCLPLVLTLTGVQLHRAAALYQQSQGMSMQDLRGVPKPRNGHKHAAQEE